MESQAARRVAQPEPGEPTFEEALSRLEAIVNQLESGDLTLDRALVLFEEGISLSRLCSRKLEEAEGRIEQLLERDGELRLEPLVPGARVEPGASTASEEDG